MSAKRRVWAGLSSQGFVPLSAEERAHLEARAKRLLQMLVLGLVAPFASIGVMVLLMMASDAEAVEGVGCLGFGFLLPLMSVMMAEDARKRRKGLKRDLARGEVEGFIGTAKALTSMDKALARLTRDGTLVTEHDHQVRILPESGYLFAIDGVFRKDFLKPDVLEVAGASAPLRQPRSGAADPAPRVFVLNADERSELKERSSQLWRTPLPAFAAVVYASLGAFMWLTHDGDWVERHERPAILWGLIGAAGLFQLFRRYLTAMRVGRDGERGAAIEVYRKNRDGVSQRLIILKESRLIWSVDELPAEWRSKKI